MKRKSRDATESISSLKKQKTIGLSSSQKVIADNDVLYFLNQGKKNIVKTELALLFDTPKKIEALLIYSNYQMFGWAVEHQDTELMQYIMNKTTERGKFLIVCHNNYELLNKLIDLAVEKIKDGTYDAFSSKKALQILLEANPDKSYVIAEALKKAIDNNSSDNSEFVDILKTDFKALIPDLEETEDDNYQTNEEVRATFSSRESDIEQELVGESSYTSDNLC